jgi:hypothetical protein
MIVKAFPLGTHKQGSQNRFETACRQFIAWSFTAWDNMQFNGRKCVSLEQSGQ